LRLLTVGLNLSVHTDPTEIFERTDIDAVVIATITSTHAPLALKAIEKGLVSIGPESTNLSPAQASH
jgi:hypothetical protein